MRGNTPQEALDKCCHKYFSELWSLALSTGPLLWICHVLSAANKRLGGVTGILQNLGAAIRVPSCQSQAGWGDFSKEQGEGRAELTGPTEGGAGRMLKHLQSGFAFRESGKSIFYA